MPVRRPQLRVLALLAIALPGVADAATPVTLAPTSYATEKGADGGEPVARMALRDQSGSQNDPTRYVRFGTAGKSYRGTRSFGVPRDVDLAALESLRVRVSYRGPTQREQKWSWEILDWRRGKWQKLGDNAAALDGVWSELAFAPPGDPARFVAPSTREVRLRVKSKGSAGAALIDWEALELSLADPPVPSEPPTLGDCPLLPADNVWNARVDSLPVHPRSGDWVASLGASTGLHPDFGAGEWDGGPIGIPWTTVGQAQPRVDVDFQYGDESDAGPYPIPSDAPVEGGADADGDRHVLVVDRDACLLYEMFDAHPNQDGSWSGGSGAVFDLRSNALRPDGWTSADAAGFAILPGLVRREEVEAGEIAHALRFTSAHIRHAYVWPARHRATCGGHGATDLAVPPMGQRFRLQASFDVSGFSHDTQVILTALKRYGMLLADCGSSWYLSGAPDPGWDDDTLVSELRRVPGSAFEAVDSSPLLVDPDSGQAAP
jgi:hypothetical protein